MKTLVPVFVLAFVIVSSSAAQSRAPLSFFRPAHTDVADVALTGAATADFNGDGLPDIAVGAPSTGTVHVALRGGRAFAPAVGYAVGTGRGHLATGDFNNDGAIDIVSAGAGIVVLPGNGDGTFQSGQSSFGSAADVVVADFDGDGRLDIASVGKNSMSTIPDTVDVYPGLGDGTFGPPQTVFTTDNGAAALAAADLNADGRIDLVFGLRDIRSLQLYLNTGAFAFAPSGSALINVGPSRTLAGDIDGNGTIDVVTADFQGTVSWFPGNGDGTVAAGRAFSAGPAACPPGPCVAPMWLALDDMNGDGALDIVTANQQPGSASILVNDGAGGFGAPTTLDVRTFAYAVLTADFDADGAVDVAVTSSDAAFLDAGPRIVSTFLSKDGIRGPRRRN